MRPAVASDIDRLVDLMTEFYAEGDYRLDRHRAASSFADLLSDERYGRVWLIEEPASDDVVGYIVLTIVHSMEYGGAAAFLDDFFVRSGYRGRGLGTQALVVVREYCVSRGVRAVHVEVGRDNATAQVVYRRAGFAETNRQLLTMKLADPSHLT